MLQGVKMAREQLDQENEEPHGDVPGVRIMTDSKSLVQALQKGANLQDDERTTEIWGELIRIRNAGTRNVRVMWVPAHVGIEGNERANALAAIGGSGGIAGVGRWGDSGTRCSLVTLGPFAEKYEKLRREGAPKQVVHQPPHVGIVDGAEALVAHGAHGAVGGCDVGRWRRAEQEGRRGA